MKKNILIFLFIIFSFFFKVYSQPKPFDYIRLKYDHSIYIGPGNKVDVSMKPISKDFVKVTALIDGKKTEIEIPHKKFEEIFDELFKIKAKDLIEDAKMGLDGADTEIQFGSYESHISYKIWGLDSGDEKSKLKDFLKATRKILEVVNVKIREIN
jgi:hypothetical protein